MNTTANTAATIGITFACCLIFVVSLLGNSFIAVIVYKTQSLRKPINFFIVNMAMSDLLFPIFLFPAELSYRYTDSWLISGPLGQALCKLLPFLAEVSIGVSIQSLVLIAVDRFGAVVFPLRSPLISSKLCPFFILATWIIAIAVASPYFFASKLIEHQGQLFCSMQWNEAFGESSSVRNYLLALCVVSLYVPTVLLTILYSIIIIKIKSQKIPGEQSAIAEQQRAKRNKNVLKMAIAIVLGFVLCWIPWSIGILLSSFARDALSFGFFVFWNITQVMAFSNCAINPCICFIFSTNYRGALKRVLNCFRGATVSVSGGAQRE